MSGHFCCPLTIRVSGTFGKLGDMAQALAVGPYSDNPIETGDYGLSVPTSPEHNTRQSEFVQQLNSCLGIQQFSFDKLLCEQLGTQNIGLQHYFPSSPPTLVPNISKAHMHRLGVLMALLQGKKGWVMYPAGAQDRLWAEMEGDLLSTKGTTMTILLLPASTF